MGGSGCQAVNVEVKTSESVYGDYMNLGCERVSEYVQQVQRNRSEAGLAFEAS